MTETKPEKCEICELHAPSEYLYRIWVCPDCAIEQKRFNLDIKVSMEEKSVENLLKYDQSHKLRMDLFNATTASINEVKRIIDEDGRIENKQFKLALVIQERIKAQQAIIFEKQNELVDAQVVQRSNQQYLTELTNKLRQEEREKLRLNDSNYKPNAPTLGTKQRTTGVNKKVEKTDIIEAVKELNTEFPSLNMTESMFRMLMVVKKRNVKDTLYDMRRGLKEAKSEASSD